MKRKAFISMIVVVALAFSLTVPAMANDDDYANAPQDWDTYTNPNVMVPNPSFNDQLPEHPTTNPRFIPGPLARPSHGETTITDYNDDHPDGNWILSDGDDTDQTPDRRSDDVDIAVWAKIVDLGDASTLIYCIDIEWGNMRFVFGRNSGAWNPETRSYGAVDTGSWWIDNSTDPNKGGDESYLDGINNRVTVTNRSNAAINAAFDYSFYSSFDGTNGAGDETDNLFNKDETDEDLVVGNFFHVPVAVNSTEVERILGEIGGLDEDDPEYDEDLAELILELEKLYADARDDAANESNDAAIAASKILTDDAGQTVQQQVVGRLNAAVPLASAATPNQLGIQGTLPSETVMFAFSGTPDDDSGLLGAPFTKVGVITVTITPAGGTTDPGGGTGGG